VGHAALAVSDLHDAGRDPPLGGLDLLVVAAETCPPPARARSAVRRLEILAGCMVGTTKVPACSAIAMASSLIK
jgi:hypothetical protein